MSFKVAVGDAGWTPAGSRFVVTSIDDEGIEIVYEDNEAGYLFNDQLASYFWDGPPSAAGPKAHTAPERAPLSEAARRKATPVYSGVLMYFPDAIDEVARVSYVGNEQHNRGQPLHWDRSKSKDHLDAASRHLKDHGAKGPLDTDGTYHLAKAAWRALAELQLAIEAEVTFGK